MPSLRDQLRQTFNHDGKDHLNVSFQAKTRFGKNVSIESRRRFYIPHLGEFSSPRCFANWMISGGDDTRRHSHERMTIPHLSLPQLRAFMLFAKFYQIVAIRDMYVNHADLLELNWVSYKLHLTGVKEFDRWESYPEIAKLLVRHVIDHYTAPFDWSQIDPKLPQLVQQRIRDIALAAGTPANQIVNLFEADKVAKERKAQQQAKRVRRTREVNLDTLENLNTAPELPEQPTPAESAQADAPVSGETVADTQAVEA